MAAVDYTDELIATAAAIVAEGKGILAADESEGTIGKRFAPIGVENIRENRRRYRQLLFTTPGLGEYVSAAICFEETLLETTPEGKPFVELLSEGGIIPGIKVDKGTRLLPFTDGEKATQGLDELAVRCARYYEAGARFAKWRAVVKISETCPSEAAIHEVAWGLARYAAICQANGLVPIVEPEVLMDGPHSIEVSAAVTERVQAATFKALSDQKVLLEGALLKPNMVRPGTDWEGECTAADIAAATVRVLQHTVPVALPGITFLSGGMSEAEATRALDAINKLDAKKPWALTFSYGRALQATVLSVWKGEDENIEAAQAALLLRARCNSLAAKGEYDPSAETADAADVSLHVKDYTY
eukprot:PLAT15567.1.p1 GENE.PLAT15567.1~~PLAT15567.1.p1  ORF type:complete len:379 (+),score=212.76 PLAT15567.1:64-1137(+)